MCEPLLSKEPSISMTKENPQQDTSVLFKITARQRVDGYQLELPL